MRNPGIEKISIVLVLSVLAGQLGAQARIEPVAESLQASGLTPGGEVAWIGVWREPEAGGAYTEITQLRETTVADAAGQASLELGREVPALSAWGAVDLQSGSHAVTSGPLHRGNRGVESPSRDRCTQLENVQMSVWRPEDCVAGVPT